MGEGLIIGYPQREEVQRQIEEHLKPGELVMRENKMRGDYQIGVSKSGHIEKDNQASLVLAPGPSHMIQNKYFGGYTVWTKEAVVWPDFFREPRIRERETYAVGTEAVSEFFTILPNLSRWEQRFTYYQVEYLRVLNMLGIEGADITQTIRNEVASELLRKLLHTVPNHITSGLAMSSAVDTSVEFAHFVAKSFSEVDIITYLNALIDTGLHGRGLEVPVPVEGATRLISVDEYFRGLSHHYKVQTQPASFTRRMFEHD